MNKEQYLLLKLAEECTEVAQMCSKVIQFGLDEVYIDSTNRQRLHNEINDLFTILGMLNGIGFDYTLDQNYAIEKREKVLKYFNISKDLGAVDKNSQL